MGMRARRVRATRYPTDVQIGIIGGSGIYGLENLRAVSEVRPRTPFGIPSDAILVGELNGVKVAFLARHGRGHVLTPSEVPARANIFAFKLLGVREVFSLSACGSLQEHLKPRDFVIPDQLFDRTKQRPNTFFGNGLVAHVAFDEPFCPELRALTVSACKELGIPVHDGGTYVCIEGPQFSTRAESQFHRSLGFSIIGMTAVPEAKLAREAQLCYVTVAQITDYDVWKQGEEVSSDLVLANLQANAANAKRLVARLIALTSARVRRCRCGTALANALFTDPTKRSRRTVAALAPLLEGVR